MHHIENIQKLFSSSDVEHPMIESYDVGTIELPTGRIVACDPLITTDMPPFTTFFPSGSFPVVLHKEKDSNCVAYIEIRFSSEKVTTWEMALTEGQNLDDLSEEEIFGYPVESGMGCFMDAATQNGLFRLEQTLFERKGDDFMGIYEEFFHGEFFDQKGAIDQYAFLKPQEQEAGSIFAFEAGYGEGFYGSYIGFDASGQPVKLVSEFIEIGS